MVKWPVRLTDSPASLSDNLRSAMERHYWQRIYRAWMKRLSASQYPDYAREALAEAKADQAILRARRYGHPLLEES